MHRGHGQCFGAEQGGADPELPSEAYGEWAELSSIGQPCNSSRHEAWGGECTHWGCRCSKQDPRACILLPCGHGYEQNPVPRLREACLEMEESCEVHRGGVRVQASRRECAGVCTELPQMFCDRRFACPGDVR